jgi:hypothetical protein
MKPSDYLSILTHLASSFSSTHIRELQQHSETNPGWFNIDLQQSHVCPSGSNSIQDSRDHNTVQASSSQQSVGSHFLAPSISTPHEDAFSPVMQTETSSLSAASLPSQTNGVTNDDLETRSNSILDSQDNNTVQASSSLQSLDSYSSAPSISTPHKDAFSPVTQTETSSLSTASLPSQTNGVTNNDLETRSNSILDSQDHNTVQASSSQQPVGSHFSAPLISTPPVTQTDTSSLSAPPLPSQRNGVTDDNLDARRGIDVKADELRHQQGEDGVRDTGDKDRVDGDRADGLRNDQGEDEVRDAGDTIDMVDGDTENRLENGDKMDEDEDRNAAGKGQVDGDGVIGAKSADNDKDMDSDQTIPGRRATVDGDGQIVENDFESEEGMHDAAEVRDIDADIDAGMDIDKAEKLPRSSRTRNTLGTQPSMSADIDAGMDIDKAEKLPRSSRTRNTLGTQPSMSSSTYTKPRRKKNPASAYQGPSSQKQIDDRPHLFDSEQRTPIGESLRILKVCIAPCYFLFI